MSQQVEGVRSLVLKSNEQLAALRQKLKNEKKNTALNKVQRRRAFFTSAAEEREYVESKYKPDSFPLRLMALTQSHYLQLFMTSLLVTDVMIVVVELFVDAEFPYCRTIVRDAVSCCNASHYDSSHGSSHRSLAGGQPLCDYPYIDMPHYPAACDDHKYASVHNVSYALFLATLFILCSFELELAALFFVLRGGFFKNKLYLIDFVVVTAALILEVVVKYGVGTNEGDIAGVLTFARCWRFVRLGHGLVSSLHEAHVSQVEEMSATVNGLMQQVGYLHTRMEHLEEEALMRAGGKAIKKFGKRRISVLSNPFSRLSYREGDKATTTTTTNAPVTV